MVLPTYTGGTLVKLTKPCLHANGYHQAYLVPGHRHRGRVLAGVAAPPLPEISAYRSDFDHALRMCSTTTLQSPVFACLRSVLILERFTPMHNYDMQSNWTEASYFKKKKFAVPSGISWYTGKVYMQNETELRILGNVKLESTETKGNSKQTTGNSCGHCGPGNEAY